MKLETLLLFILVALFFSTFLMLGFIVVNMEKEGAKCIQNPMNWTMERLDGVVCGCYNVQKP